MQNNGLAFANHHIQTDRLFYTYEVSEGFGDCVKYMLPLFGELRDKRPDGRVILKKKMSSNLVDYILLITNLLKQPTVH